jgi:HEXXH motif-containing protein
MVFSLFSSLNQLIQSQAIGNQLADTALLIEQDPHTTQPTDFAAYFDLIQAQQNNNHTHPKEFEQALNAANMRLNQYKKKALQHPFIKPTAHPPRVTTLNDLYYSDVEIESLKRWWDMEPQNALNLAPISMVELVTAKNLISDALSQLLDCAPSIYAEVQTIVTDIVMAKPGDRCRMTFGGISSFAAWGGICIHFSSDTHWVDLFKKLVHECAHLLLFAIARKQPLVLNDSTERHKSPLRDDARPIDGIFHAAFVSAREAFAFNAWLIRNEFAMQTQASIFEIERVEKHLQNSVLTFWDACGQLDAHAELSELGMCVISDAQSYIRETFEVQSI